MGVIFKDLQRVQWTRLHAAGGASARAVPALLSKAAWSDRDTARLAVDELGDLVCELGFVVQEATAPTVPFLVELAGAPHVLCKADVLELLRKIFIGRQWSAASHTFSSGTYIHLAQQLEWETAAQEAVRAGRHVYDGLLSSVDPDVAQAAAKLLRSFAEESRLSPAPRDVKPTDEAPLRSPAQGHPW
ncbi:hypothetical protein ACIRP3_00960 [Streptomyces sp. NPDC101209]|uniref:hypothetical protein n=1 Tax=Streptomyces sp. NPDC101209 TaxID=3366129 RepID=UPI00380087E3